MLTNNAQEILKELSKEVGEGWFRHQLAANACDELLHSINANGVFTTKIDGFIHAASLTSPFIIRYAKELDDRSEDPLDLPEVTRWEPKDSATRYAEWQVDFHWKIDTRPWQYVLYSKLIRRSYADAINSADGLSESERQQCLQINQHFWDAVEVAYIYRSEILERSRGYERHPDATAGSKDRGYTYTSLVPEPDYSFSRLRFELTGPELGAGTDEEYDIPTGFPAIPTVVYPEITEAARLWTREAKAAGLCDDYLRVRLGDRFVPTRLDGWEASLRDLVRYVRPDERDELLAVWQPESADEDSRIKAAANFFVYAQGVFWRRLGGQESKQLSEFLKTAIAPLESLVQDGGARRFLELVASSLSVEAGRDNVDDETLDLVRPIHPRFSVYDPLEPLPWHAKNPERYVQRMRRLGYEI